MKIVVTDLTRFTNKDILCLAGLTTDSTTCVRPLLNVHPYYLSFADCKKNGILPGVVLEADFKPAPTACAPHVEDYNFSNLKRVGALSSGGFRDLLHKSSVASVYVGLGSTDAPGSKVLTSATCSITTVRVPPKSFQVLQDQFNPERIKASFIDESGQAYRYLSITDLGFYDNVGKKATRKIPAASITEFIQGQAELFLRVGLSRKFKSEDGRDGFWLQVNGIYSFPGYDKVVREYN